MLLLCLQDWNFKNMCQIMLTSHLCDLTVILGYRGDSVEEIELPSQWLQFRPVFQHLQAQHCWKYWSNPQDIFQLWLWRPNQTEFETTTSNYFFFWRNKKYEVVCHVLNQFWDQVLTHTFTILGSHCINGFVHASRTLANWPLKYNLISCWCSCSWAIAVWHC